MDFQKIQDGNLEQEIDYLTRLLSTQMGQSKVRNVLQAGELQAIFEDHYQHVEKLDPDEAEFEFNYQFDLHGARNLVYLANYRQVTLMRLVLDLAIEIGQLREVDYHRYVRQMGSDSIVRSSIPYQYHDGSLYRGGRFIDSIQTRDPPTDQQVVLRNFEEQEWPKFIKAPILKWEELKIENPDVSDKELKKLLNTQWKPSRVKSVCRQLRKSFQNQLHFGEGDGGTLIRMKDIALQQLIENKPKVTPK